MPIERVVIENFKAFGHLDLPLNPHMNLIVGNNEVGKSTLLEAIHAVVTGQLHGRGIAYEITPYLFHQPAVDEYLARLRDGQPGSPPRIVIEAYLGRDATLASLRGTNNSLGADMAGIRLLIELNEDYRPEFDAYLREHQGQLAGGVLHRPLVFLRQQWRHRPQHPIRLHDNRYHQCQDLFRHGSLHRQHHRPGAFSGSARGLVAELSPHAAELFPGNGRGGHQHVPGRKCGRCQQ
ncbi:AAA family ATPase [Pseudoxanthomonas mexicana]